MVDKYGTGQDPYCYENTIVLRNNFNIQDEDLLLKAEREITTAASNTIMFSPPPYDLEYFRKIHYILFSRVYGWAGKLRNIDISKNDTRFCVVNRIEPEANKIFKELKEKNYFIDLSSENFSEHIAKLYGDINMLHPFREGNGRTQRILFDHIALNASYRMNWAVTKIDKWKQANILAVNCDYSSLQNIFKAGLEKIA